MKELSTEEKAKRYDEAIKLVNSKWHYKNQPCLIDVSDIFPELKESEGERIERTRKELTDFIKRKFENSCSPTPSKNILANWIAWLEKQKSEPNWCHHKVDLSNCSEEYRKAYYDGWNNCNMQHSQYKSESNDVVKCLINGMKFYYENNTEATWGTEKFSMKVKDILAWLEKQGDKANKVESKFKIGDWIIEPREGEPDGLWHIDRIEDGCYWSDKCGCTIGYADKHWHLWTIQDAKDGDVLYINNTLSKSITLYKSFNHGIISKYASYSNFGFEGENYLTLNDGYILPATKEQRAFLFQRMKESGYEWNADKKELIKL